MSRDLLENAFEQYEPLISNDEPFLTSESNANLETMPPSPAYKYVFTLPESMADRELDITVKDDGSVIVVAASNERQNSQHEPRVELSAMMTLPDDADSHTVKVNVCNRKLTVTIQRAEIDIKDRKLFIQAD